MFGSFGSWIAPQLVHATVFVNASARSSIAAPQFRQLKPAALTSGPVCAGLRFFSASASNSTKWPAKSSGGASL